MGIQYDGFGWAHDSSGDYNGDGYNDILVSERYAGSSSEGAAYIAWGSATVSSMDAADLGTMISDTTDSATDSDVIALPTTASSAMAEFRLEIHVKCGQNDFFNQKTYLLSGQPSRCQAINLA